MHHGGSKSEIVERLQKEILSLEGFKEPSSHHCAVGLGSLESVFPNGIFPTGVVHEFMSHSPEETAATGGFVAGLLGRLIPQGGMCLWIGTKRTLYPAGLRIFGIDPDRIIFIDLVHERDVLWTVEEALKCEALTVVVGELKEISFMQSRRLQLAVEESGVTGLMHCYQPDKIGNTTSVVRWKISPLASVLEAGLPGVGHPCWKVELLKVRNGRPGSWQLLWRDGQFGQMDKVERTQEGTLSYTG